MATARDDPGKDRKLKALRDAGLWDRADYVRKQGWATGKVFPKRPHG